MASLHKPVLWSKFGPVTLSSSGTVIIDVQPDTNQAVASKLMMILMDCLSRRSY